MLFGENWNNPDLDLKTRCIITVVALVSSGVTDSSLANHLQNAKAHGVTKSEIAAILTHVAFYAGWPKAWAAFNLAKEVWKEEIPAEATEMEKYQKSLFFPIGELNDAYARYFSGRSFLAPVSASQIGIHNVTFTDIFRNAMKDIQYTDSFYFRSDKKHARIEYMSRRISDNTYVYVFRDIDENEKCRYNYQHCMGLGRSGYTREKFEQSKETFGVYVLQSNCAKSPEEVFSGYKKRWGIETLYQYMKNKADFNDLMISDYYKEQGFAFLMLITGQIHQKMIAAVKKLDNNAISVHDILLMARCMKMERRGSNWNLKNVRKRDLQMLKQLGFEPKITVTDS